MKTLSELKKEAGILRKKNMARAEILKEETEKRKIKREIGELKRPRITSALGQVKSISGVGAKSIGSSIKSGLKRQLEIGYEEGKYRKRKRMSRK